MGYIVKMVSDDVLEVKDSVVSLRETRHTFWYYDIKNWKRSITGKEHEIPTHDVDKNTKKWVKDYYIPKLVDVK